MEISEVVGQRKGWDHLGALGLGSRVVEAWWALAEALRSALGVLEDVVFELLELLGLRSATGELRLAFLVEGERIGGLEG